MASTSYQTGTSSNLSQSGTQIVPGMTNLYQDLLNRNQANYQNVLGAYQQGRGNLAATLPGIYNSYGGLTSDINDQFTRAYGVGSQDIKREADQRQGRAVQGLISSGLGNSTVQSSLAAGISRQAQQEYGRLATGLAGQAADRRQQVGLAQLNSRMQGLGMQDALTRSYMGDLAGFHFANTLGGLTGSYGTSAGSSTSAGRSTSADAIPFARPSSAGSGGMGGGGYGGGAPNSLGGVGGYAYPQSYNDPYPRGTPGANGDPEGWNDPSMWAGPNQNPVTGGWQGDNTDLGIDYLNNFGY